MSETMIPLSEARKGDVVHLGGDFPVLEVGQGTVKLDTGGGLGWHLVAALESFGATVTQSVPPRSLPGWRGAMVESGNGRDSAVRIYLTGGEPWINDEGEAMSSEEVVEYLGDDWRLVTRPVTDEMVKTAYQAFLYDSSAHNRDGIRAALEAVLGGGDER